MKRQSCYCHSHAGQWFEVQKHYLGSLVEAFSVIVLQEVDQSGLRNSLQ